MASGAKREMMVVARKIALAPKFESLILAGKNFARSKCHRTFGTSPLFLATLYRCKSKHRHGPWLCLTATSIQRFLILLLLSRYRDIKPRSNKIKKSRVVIEEVKHRFQSSKNELNILARTFFKWRQSAKNAMLTLADANRQRNRVKDEQ